MILMPGAACRQVSVTRFAGNARRLQEMFVRQGLWLMDALAINRIRVIGGNFKLKCPAITMRRGAGTQIDLPVFFKMVGHILLIKILEAIVPETDAALSHSIPQSQGAKANHVWATLFSGHTSPLRSGNFANIQGDKKMTIAYQAYAKGGANCTAETPRAAAEQFFAQNPNKRKCSVTQGKIDGAFFVVTYSNRHAGGMPASWRDVTKKMVSELPGAQNA